MRRHLPSSDQWNCMDARLKKLTFRACHRGMKELDLVLGGFAASELQSLTPDELDQFERILDLQEPDLFAWIMGFEDVPQEYDWPIMGRILSFRLNPSDYSYSSRN